VKIGLLAKPPGSDGDHGGGPFIFGIGFGPAWPGGGKFAARESAGISCRAHSHRFIVLWILAQSPRVHGRGAGPPRGVRPDIVGWPATHRSAACGSGGDQEVFDSDGVFFDKAELQETKVARTALRSVNDAFTLDVMLQQLGVGH